jgi:hypothetical protein
MVVEPVAPTKARITDKSETETAIIYELIIISKLIDTNRELFISVTFESPPGSILSSELRHGCAWSG